MKALLIVLHQMFVQSGDGVNGQKSMEKMDQAKELMLLEQAGIDILRSICAVVRSTPTHCVGVHTLCGECAEGYFIESMR